MKKILIEMASGVQKTLDMFTNVLRKVKERVSKYVPSFKTPKALPSTEDKPTEIEKISYPCKTTYRGNIRHLFLFIMSNTSSYKNKETGEYTDKDAGL